MLRRAQLSTSSIKDFAQEFASLDKPNEVTSSHALDALADIYVEENKKEQAMQVLDLLSQKYDPIRERYWNYRKSALEPAGVAA